VDTGQSGTVKNWGVESAEVDTFRHDVARVDNAGEKACPSLFSELQEVEVAIFTLIAKFPNFSVVSFIGVYGPKFTKFSKLVKP